MKIITLATRFGLGGAELNALLLAERLSANHGLEVHSCFFMYSNGAIDSSSQSIFLFPRETSNPFYLLVILYRLFRYLIAEKPDIVIGFQPFANVIGALCCFIARCKFIGSQQNPSFSQGKVIGFIEKVIGSSALYSANIAVSNSVINSYKNYPQSYRRKMVCIYNGFQERTQKSEKDLVRAKLGIPIGVPVIGFMGRIAYQKYPEFMLEVLEHVDCQDVVLAYAGIGPELDSLKSLVESRSLKHKVLFLGSLKYQDIFSFYDAIDIFVLPSRYEGFGRTLVESMQSGVPIIANDIDVTKEVIGIDYCVAPLEPKIWANKICTLLADNTLYQDISNAGIVRCKKFSIDQMILGHYQLIIDTVGELNEE